MNKAASTTIQKIIPAHPKFHYFGKLVPSDSPARDDRYSSVESKYLTQTLINLDKFTELNKSKISKILKEVKKAKQNKKVFFFFK